MVQLTFEANLNFEAGRVMISEVVSEDRFFDLFPFLSDVPDKRLGNLAANDIEMNVVLVCDRLQNPGHGVFLDKKFDVMRLPAPKI